MPRPFDKKRTGSLVPGKPSPRREGAQHEKREGAQHEKREGAQPETREGALDVKRDGASFGKRHRTPYGQRDSASYQKRDSGPRPKRDDDGVIRLYGLHAVEAALGNEARAINKLMMTENAENKLAALVAKRGVPPQRVTPRDLDRLLGPDTVHQGVMLETVDLEEPLLADLAEIAAGGGGPVILLDQVTDPHNVGAVLRSAAVFGAAGVVMTRRNSPPLNGTLAKSASGALELVPVVLAQNLSGALNDLRDAGFTILALDGEAETLLEDEPLTGAIALVFGAEGKGLRQLTRATSDRLVRIATGGTLDSLNVSNAAAIALHLAAMRRRGKA